MKLTTVSTITIKVAMSIVTIAIVPLSGSSAGTITLLVPFEWRPAANKNVN